MDSRQIKNIAKASSLTALVTLSSFTFYRAIAATATLPVIAKIIRAIEVSVTASLDFGTLAVTREAQAEITVDPVSQTSRIDGSGAISAIGSQPSPGFIRIKGAPQSVIVSLETNNMFITNGASFMTVSNFHLGSAFAGPTITVTPDVSNSSILFPVGATLVAHTGQVTGVYTGSNTIFANYQ
ncbi:MAG: DUF4402 domain-containing protein [Pseudomonadota bacterium]